MIKKFRNNGAAGALLDEYEKVLDELIHVISGISASDLTRIMDKETKDEDCRSIQTILSHVVESGYTYVIEVRRFLGEGTAYREKKLLSSIDEYIPALKEMFEFNIELFKEYPDLKMEEYDSEKKIKVRWGQKYDVDQLFEHAIVHILRHRRQIERMLLKNGIDQ